MWWMLLAVVLYNMSQYLEAKLIQMLGDVNIGKREQIRI